MRPDTTDLPAKLYTSLDENRYKAEFELLDRYHTFSGELLRLSLLGIAVFGFLFKETFLKIDWKSPLPKPIWISKYAALASILFLALASACALFQRLLSTDAVRYFVYALRLQTSNTAPGKHEDRTCEISERDSWLCRRDQFLGWSLRLKVGAVIFLCLGAMGLGLTFLLLLLPANIPLVHDATK